MAGKCTPRLFSLVQTGRSGQPLDRFARTVRGCLRDVVKEAVQISERQQVGIRVVDRWRSPPSRNRTRVEIPHPGRR